MLLSIDSVSAGSPENHLIYYVAVEWLFSSLMADEIAKAQAAQPGGDNKEIPAKILFEDDLFIHNKCSIFFNVFPKNL